MFDFLLYNTYIAICQLFFDVFWGAVSAVLCILTGISGLGMNLWRLMLLLNFLQEHGE